MEFSEEPHFNVSGVTDPTNLGGHGSDTVLRTKEALAKDTAALNHEEPAQPTSISGAPESIADSHVRLGDAAEHQGRPLEAVQEYQRAAELQPSEPHLFVWGAELLLHRAFEPAIEVFTKGHRLYPDSVRMLLGLSVATYDQGATERGVQLLLEACDLNPSDPAPYLFLGKLQETEKIEPPGWTEEFKRFASLHPENAMAHYYYAVALSKQSPGTEDFALVESELMRAIELDPKLGNAYLQFGILYPQKRMHPRPSAPSKELLNFCRCPMKRTTAWRNSTANPGKPRKPARKRHFTIRPRNKIRKKRSSSAAKSSNSSTPYAGRTLLNLHQPRSRSRSKPVRVLHL